MEAGLSALLKDQLGARRVSVENVQPIFGGYSRETFSFDARIEHPDGRIDNRALILRRDPVPASSILPTDRGIEFRLLQRAKAALGVNAPDAIALDATGAYVEREALVIERLSGSSDLSPLFGGADSDKLEAVATSLCEQFAKMHLASVEAIDPDGELRDPLKKGVDTSSWEAYVRSQIAYLKRNYVNTAFDALPIFYDAYCSLEQNLPTPARLTFVHGDAQPSNYLYAGDKISGIIDWELAHIGDPREDLGALYHVQGLMGWDLMGAVKVDGGFLGHYTKLTGIPVSRKDLDFFRLLWLSGVQSPPLEAVKRRLAGEHDEFLHLYIIQPIISGMTAFAAQLGYPTAGGTA